MFSIPLAGHFPIHTATKLQRNPYHTVCDLSDVVKQLSLDLDLTPSERCLILVHAKLFDDITKVANGVVRVTLQFSGSVDRKVTCQWNTEH